MKSILAKILPAVLMAGLLSISCTQKSPDQSMSELNWESVQDSTDIVVTITGFSGPEAVRYDPDQDVYFVANFNGSPVDDSNGFISRVSPEGTIDSLRFMTGTEEFPLHGPRGMYINGQTLWVADADGIHGFNTETGEQMSFVDFTSFEPGFLNDIIVASDNKIYVTDTGNSTVYIVEESTPSLLVDSLPAPPNGITIDADNNIILAPWDGALTFPVLEVGDPGYTDYATAQSGGNFDGIEFLNGRMIAASQVDSSLHVFYDGEDHLAVHTPGRPADIGLDTQRNQVAVPYIDLNRVDIWQLPEE